MAENRMLSLNEVSGFSVEDLEPRMEMQMLGLGSGLGSDIHHTRFSSQTTIIFPRGTVV
jgi:hypothetical protein